MRLGTIPTELGTTFIGDVHSKDWGLWSFSPVKDDGILARFTWRHNEVRSFFFFFFVDGLWDRPRSEW